MQMCPCVTGGNINGRKLIHLTLLVTLKRRWPSRAGYFRHCQQFNSKLIGWQLYKRPGVASRPLDGNSIAEWSAFRVFYSSSQLQYVPSSNSNRHQNICQFSIFCPLGPCGSVSQPAGKLQEDALGQISFIGRWLPELQDGRFLLFQPVVLFALIFYPFLSPSPQFECFTREQHAVQDECWEKTLDSTFERYVRSKTIYHILSN